MNKIRTRQIEQLANMLPKSYRLIRVSEVTKDVSKKEIEEAGLEFVPDGSYKKYSRSLQPINHKKALKKAYAKRAEYMKSADDRKLFYIPCYLLVRL